MSTNQNTAPSRVVGVDVFRGFVMFLMMAEVLKLAEVAGRHPEGSFWSFLAYHQSHVAWVGCSLHDLIQPGFSFLVGVALPFSLASRRSQGQSTALLIMHAAWRAFVLVVLGILLRSMHRQQTYFTFEDTLSQIGLGYLPLFLFGLARPPWRWAGLALIIVGYWCAFVLFPLPAGDFDYTSVGVPDDWPHHATGLAAHWNKNSNLAWSFDTWFLNLFPREERFAYNSGGYATLSFIPALGTMLLGLLAGDWLRREISTTKKLSWIVLIGIACLFAGSLANGLGVCPNVKRIWTPSWILFSGGWCFLLLAGFYTICDVWRLQRWAFPLRVIGANSIAAYCMAHLMHDFLVTNYRINLGQQVFEFFGTAYAPLMEGIAVLAAYWLILYWMYRRKIFLKI